MNQGFLDLVGFITVVGEPHFFMGRIDPVECIGVSGQRNGNALNVKPPAMRVRDDCYTKITFPL